MIKKISIFFLLLLAGYEVCAQQVILTGEDLTPELTEEYIKWERINCQDTPCLSEIKNYFLNIGFLQVQIDTSSLDDLKKPTIRTGPRYKMGLIDINSVPEEFYSEAKVLFEKGKYYHIQSIDSFLMELMSFYGNMGYAHAKVYFSPTFLMPGRLDGKIIIEKGEIKVFGGIKDDEDNINPKWLERITGIIEGQKFSQELLEGIPNIIQKSGYELVEPIKLSNDDENKIHVRIRTEPVSRGIFDGIVGFYYAEEIARPVMTGYLNLDYPYLFKRPQQLNLKWERLKAASQQLQVEYMAHHIWGRNFDLGAAFELLKLDSSFTKVDFSGKLQYALSEKWKLFVTLENQNASLNSVPEIITDQLLISGNQIFSLGGGIEIDLNIIESMVHITSGKKKIIKEPGVDPAYYPENLNGLHQFKIRFETLAHFPIAKKLEWEGNIKAGMVDGEVIYQNDYFLLGGLQTLRGFKEREFFVSRYQIIRQELKWKIGGDGYLFLFTDIARLRINDNLKWYSSLGAGLKQRAGDNGTVNFILATPSRQGIEYKFAESVVHIGYLLNF